MVNFMVTTGSFVFEYFVPIQKEAYTSGAYAISGIAINTTITRNNVKYTAEELSLSAASLVGKPVLKDHDQKIDSIVGVVESAEFDGDAIAFRARIMDEKVKLMIEDGRIKNVSIGAQVRELVKEKKEGEGDVVTAKGISFLELSLVAVPGDSNAVIFQAQSAKPLMAVAERFESRLRLNEVQNKMKVNEQDGEPNPAPQSQQPQAPAPGQALSLEDVLKALAGLNAKIDSLLQGGKKEEEAEGEEPKKPEDKKEAEDENSDEDKKKKGEEKMNELEQLKEDVSNLKKLLEENLKKGKAFVNANVEVKEESGLVFEKEQTKEGTAIWAKPDAKGFFKV